LPRSRPAPVGDTTGTEMSVGLDSTGSPVADTTAKQDTSRAAAADTGAKAAVSAADTAASRTAATSRSGQARRDTARVQEAESTKSAAVPAPAATPRQQDTSTATGQAQDTAQQQTAEAPLRDAYHQAPRDTVSADVYEGWKQFNLNCARCHGEDVLGTTIAPHLIMSLKPDGPINTKELFVQTVCAGRPEKGMPAWCALGMEIPTIDKIYQYVHGRSEAKIGPGRPARKAEG
jgi:mono/diheme cytochrome c family protein